MEQRHRQVAGVGTTIGQDTVVTVRVIEAAIGSLVGENPIVAGCDGFWTNAEPESQRFVESCSHRRRVIIDLWSSTPGVPAILAAGSRCVHASLEEPGKPGK